MRYLGREAIGGLSISDRNVYFVSSLASTRFPFKKIVAAQLYEDGLHLTRESTRPVPMIFRFREAAFAANVLARVAQL